jgi:NAD(P)-dependent dehydrogenase (short-subunit alcohol dehydrogenase family)
VSERRDGRRALVTGAARGIGLEIARALTARRAAVMVSDADADADADAYATAVAQVGGASRSVAAYAASRAAVSQLTRVAAVEYRAAGCA